MPISPISIVSNGRPASPGAREAFENQRGGVAWCPGLDLDGNGAGSSEHQGCRPGTWGGVAGCSDTSACELGQWRLERGWYSSASSGFACVWYLGHDFLWGGGRAGVWWHRIKSNFWPGAEAPGGENGALWISGGGIANGTKSLSFYVRKSNFRSGGRPP